jgi:hypothetical protein
MSTCPIGPAGEKMVKEERSWLALVRARGT